MSSEFLSSLLAGAAAGVSVDVALYPIDTLKTRSQDTRGFWKAGGFTGIYRGLSAAVIGSAPGAALFFSTYDSAKRHGSGVFGDGASLHMAAAAMGESAACLARVPTENVKQKMQAGLTGSLSETVAAIRATQGMRGFYTGYATTLMREIPFSFIQFPLWEAMKRARSRQAERPVSAIEGAIFGSIAGGFSAAVTTPLDVAKTRQMLDVEGKTYVGMVPTLRKILAEEGAGALFSGVTPRVTWITIGGFVFFGAYESVKRKLSAEAASAGAF